MTMPTYPQHPPRNFLGLPPEHSGFDGSRALILPVPYDATTSYKGGAKAGPQAIIDASTQVELYDREFDEEPALRWGIHTLPALAPDLRSPEATVDGIAAAVAGLAAHRQAARRPRRRTLHQRRRRARPAGRLRRLRNGAIGRPRRPARRVRWDALQPRLRRPPHLRVQPGRPTRHSVLGRQRGRVPARKPGARHRLLRRGHDGEDRSYFDALAERVRGKRVFLTMDLDALDPALMPATGTPEPGGLGWHDVLDIIRTVNAHAEIIAFDCVELSPIPGLHAPDFLAAKLVYKTLSLILGRRV